MWRLRDIYVVIDMQIFSWKRRKLAEYDSIQIEKRET